MNGNQRPRERVLILGAAGRDYHNFNLMYRNNPIYEVVGFTHSQIPFIESHEYPPVISGDLYPKGIPIDKEEQLEKIIKDKGVAICIMSYSDLPHTEVMNLAARVHSAGADFQMLSHWKTMVESKKPLIAVTAARTGCGKSQVCRYVIDVAREMGKQVVLVRHPMPYGNLAKQVVQRFATLEDLDRHQTTIEEREEYEQHIRNGIIVYAGVDYEKILRQAEEEADIVLWDGGNNDTPFYRPDMWIVVADPHRPGHELSHYPGDHNFREAHFIVINKANTAQQENIEQVKRNAQAVNPSAKVFVTASEVTVTDETMIRGKRVLCVDDGPTITHGNMATGAAYVAAQKFGAAEIIDPRPHFKGTLQDTLKKYPHIGKVVPAVGYSDQQRKDLADTINGIDCDVVIVGTPTDITQVFEVKHPTVRVTYAVEDMKGQGPSLKDELRKFISSQMGGKKEAERAQ